ncbi:ATP-dependent Zn protease [Litchfieldella qijiaojingensis]|uniref:ATP-dependent Zn protease n=1 Tax=Litchfieldella qijiaojingensis TaxID=980347 RepID=A0ABQ2YKM1_9GAMM|nr:ATP-dependent zinc protease [Halomonas qijiaojingensis]GGX85137.1 ATP-dependent Zn protease [Halomonas qijiaojingensis]
MNHKGYRWLRRAGAAALLLCAASLAQADDERKVFGWVEKATVEPWGVEVKAKLDSGALTSSLDARDIERFQKDGEEWVRFRLELEDEETGEVTSEVLEREVNRKLILRGAGGESRRPTVIMTICVGDTLYEEDFSLRNRGNMLYPMLLGRRTIEHLGLLDVTRTFQHKPECDEDSPLVAYEDEDD